MLMTWLRLKKMLMRVGSGCTARLQEKERHRETSNCGLKKMENGKGTGKQPPIFQRSGICYAYGAMSRGQYDDEIMRNVLAHRSTHELLIFPNHDTTKLSDVVALVAQMGWRAEDVEMGKAAQFMSGLGVAEWALLRLGVNGQIVRYPKGSNWL